MIEKQKFCASQTVNVWVSDLNSYAVPPELMPKAVEPGPRRLKRQLAENRRSHAAIRQWSKEMDALTLGALLP